MTLEFTIYFPSHFRHTFSFAKESVVFATPSSWQHISVMLSTVGHSDVHQDETNKAAVVDSYREGMDGIVLRGS